MNERQTWSASCGFVTPCCDATVELAYNNQPLPMPATVEWRGVRCPGCEKTYHVVLTREPE